MFSSESSTVCLIECKANITTRLKKTAQLSEYPFDIWRCQLLALGGISIQRTPIPSNQNEVKNISHLTAYLDKIHSPAGNTIQICLSSSKYYLVIQSCINLRCLDFFTFKDFLTSFSIDLKDYEEFEKQFLFKLFVDFGKECSILKILEDTGDVFTSSYVIINRRMKSKQLQRNIIFKMAENKIETDSDIKKRIEEEKKIIIQEIYEKKYKQKSLSDYMNVED